MRITARQLQQINERQLRNFIHSVIINEVGGSERADDIALRGMMAVATDPSATAGAALAVKGVIDFGKSLISLLADTWLYFKTGQSYIDAIRGLTGKDLTPEHQKDWRAEIAAASLHDFLDKFGTAGLEVGDIINSFLYMGENNWKMAGLCMIAAIPVVGTAIARGRTTGKFALRAGEGAALDAGIKDLKKGLKESKAAGADDVISEIDKIRSDMNGGKADFKPYEAIPDSQKAAVKEVASNIDKLADYKKHLEDLRIANSNLPEGDPRRYTGLHPDEFSEIKSTTLVAGETWNPAIEELSDDMMKAWAQAAAKNAEFFKSKVKKVHWFGLTRQENDVIEKAADFLDKSKYTSGMDLSTTGHTGPIIPKGAFVAHNSPVGSEAYPARIGWGGRTPQSGNQVQLGIEVDGTVKFAATRDAYTKNPSKDTFGDKLDAITSKRELEQKLKQYEKQIAAAPDRLDLQIGQRITKEKLAAISIDPNMQFAKKPRPASKAGELQQQLSHPDFKNEPITGPENWVEPGAPPKDASDYSYNEVAVSNWKPAAIVVNPATVVHDDIMKLLDLADEHGIPLKDGRTGNIITRESVDTLRLRAALPPGSKNIVGDDISGAGVRTRGWGQSDKPFDIKTAEPRKAAPIKETHSHMSKSRTADEQLIERWARLAGLLKT